ncbi:MAG: TetR/AcrR family transcriptional regulator [Myxococcota bacterium]
MGRTIPPNRLQDLLACATQVFIAHGYRRAQMADVAAAMGVAKGTLYLYVESKHALFAAALRHADDPPPDPSDLDLPLKTPAPDELEDELRARLAEEALPESLQRALARKHGSDGKAEFEGIVRELYARSRRRRTAIKLIDRCGRDHPALAEIFYRSGRFSQLEQLTRYLEDRIRRGYLRPVRDAAVSARFVIEAIATWAVHIHWDPAPQTVDPADAEETVVQFVLGGLSKQEGA